MRRASRLHDVPLRAVAGAREGLCVRHDGSVLRSFGGGDLAGLLQWIEQGYFDSLGVSAIWLTPFVEQIHGTFGVSGVCNVLGAIKTAKLGRFGARDLIFTVATDGLRL